MSFTRLDKEARKFDNNGNVKVSIEADNAGIGGGGGGGSSQQQVYDGATWRNKLGDSSGRAINLDHTFYSSTEITALGSSTDINLWLSAFSDNMLQLKFVETYDDEHEECVYYQHPSLGNGTKCLKLLFSYVTENSVKVVKSVHAQVADWSYTDDIVGTVSISAGAITSPDPSNPISMHTVVTTLTIVDTTPGPVVLSISGADASNYHIHEVETGTHTQGTITYVDGRTYQIHAHGDFSGASYSHTFTVTATGTTFNLTDSVTINTSGTYVPAAAGLANGAITSPAYNASAGTDVTTLTPSGGAPGSTYSLALSGSDAGLYQINNVTDGVTGSTVSADFGDTIVLETASLFNLGATGYNHSVTITNTESGASTTASVTIATSQAAAAAATLSNGAITSPPTDAASGTDVCTLTAASGGSGATLTLSLSGANAGLYQINNVTTGTTGSSVTASEGDSVVLETASLFALGATGYSHTVVVTNTEGDGGSTASVTINTSQAADPSFTNTKYWQRPSDDSLCEWGGQGVGPMGDLNTVGAPNFEEAFSMSFWYNHTTAGSPIGNTQTHFGTMYGNSHGYRLYVYAQHYGHSSYGSTLRTQYYMWFYGNGTNCQFRTSGYQYIGNNVFNNVIFVKHATTSGDACANSDIDIYHNGSAMTISNANGNWNSNTPTTLNNYQNAIYRPNAVGHEGWKYDEFATFTTDLSSSNVTTIYNSGTPGDLSGMTGLKTWYRFGDGDSNGDGTGTADSQSTIYDMSGVSGGQNLPLVNYSGTETDMIKTY